MHIFSIVGAGVNIELNNRLYEYRVKQKFSTALKGVAEYQVGIFRLSMGDTIRNDIELMLQGQPVPGLEVNISKHKLHHMPLNANCLDRFLCNTPQLILDNDQIWARHSFASFFDAIHEYPQCIQAIPLDAPHVRKYFSLHRPFHTIAVPSILRRDNISVPVSRLAVHVEQLFLPAEVHWQQVHIIIWANSEKFLNSGNRVIDLTIVDSS